MKTVKSLVMATVVLVSMLAASPVSAANLDVPTAGYPTVQSAIDAANNGDVIRIAQGVYYENLVIDRALDVTIEGGWDAVFSARTDDSSLTVIDGNDSDRVLHIRGASADVAIRNMTLQNGRTEQRGAGIRVSSDYGNVSITLVDLIIQDCDSAGSSGHGGAIFFDSYAHELVADLETVVIRRNHATGTGGGISIWASEKSGFGDITVYMSNCLLYDNIADWAGGGFNVGSYGSGLAHVVLVNNTITRNTSNNTYHGGGGVCVWDDHGGTTTAQIYNNIIYGNTANPGADVTIDTNAAGSSTEIHYSDIGELNHMAGTYNNSNLISLIPPFVDAANDDYHLAAGSPCIDAGTIAVPDPPGLPATDIEGNPRVFGVAPDMGAYEFVEAGRKGDFDGDGDIDILDFVKFAIAYGSELGDDNYNPIGDFDDAGDIDIFDFVQFAGVYGT